MNSPQWRTRSLVLACATGFAAGGLVVGGLAEALSHRPFAIATLPVDARENDGTHGARARGAGTLSHSAAVSPPAAASVLAEYNRIAAQPRTPETKRQLATLLANLAHGNPAAAMATALAEPNWAWRTELRDAVLRGWAEANANAAIAWAHALPPAERVGAIRAVLIGAAADPGTAVDIATTACASEPEHASEYGGAIIRALSEHGAFDAALRFIALQPASPLKLEQADNTFSRWAANRPAEAAAAAERLNNAELRKAALHGVAVGWSEADPIAAAAYATTLPPGDARAEVVANALPRWVERDPIAAATWLQDHGNGPDFDLGVVAVATLPQLVGQNPNLAMTLAQSISDAPLRTNTLRNLALQWAERDSSAAARYVQSSGAFADTEQATLLAEISAPQR